MSDMIDDTKASDGQPVLDGMCPKCNRRKPDRWILYLDPPPGRTLGDPSGYHGAWSPGDPVLLLTDDDVDALLGGAFCSPYLRMSAEAPAPAEEG